MVRSDRAPPMQDYPEVPKLPKLPFIASDVFLLLVAGFIAYRAPAPFEGGALIAIVTCVVVGGILLGVPFIAEYGRRTDVLLRERQDEIAALAKTTATCAEQISIATASLHGLAENYARSARTLETLPQKLQEKVAELKAQLNEISLSENEALEQELQTLRTAESDRLQSAVDELAKLAREFARVETAATQISASLTQLGEQSAAKLAGSLNLATTSSAKEIDAVLARARQQWADDSKQAETRATAALATTVSESVRTLEARLEPLIRKLAPALESTLASTVKATPPRPQSPPPPPPPAAEVAASAPQSAPAATPELLSLSLGDDAKSAPSSSPEARTSQPSSASAAPAPKPSGSEAAAAPDEPHRVPAPASSPAVHPTAPAEPATPLPPAAPRRSAERSTSAPVEAALSSDGATRLLVTAYIGIGNKLFARGSGPGLSWDKGVPLHFVSIGKWRWDTAEASSPVQIRLYKNDQTECTAVGILELEPGHQHEVTATF